MAAEVQTEKGVVRVPTGTWQVDPAHSSVEFAIKHMMISTVRGRFKEFEGRIIAAEDIANSRSSGVVKTASIDTNQADRDAHLRSPEFFEAEVYPEMRFESTRIEPLGGPRFLVVGQLTIKDATREIELETTVEGAERDPWGNERVGMRSRGTISRKSFGIAWNQALETGRVVVGDEVTILIEISAVKD